MNSYQGATKIHRYLMKRWDEVIGEYDAGPAVYDKDKWAEKGLGAGGVTGIAWEGFYAWTRPSEIERMQNLLAGTELHVFPTDGWIVEIFD